MMSRRVLSPPNVHKPTTYYSHGIAVGEVVYTSGQAPHDRNGAVWDPSDVAGHLRAAFSNLAEVLHAAEIGFGDIAKMTILLRHNEHYMLGDNSPSSKDSRLWDQNGPHLLDRGEQCQLGTVPADQLIGRAFFVYWPSGFRLEWLPVIGELGFIPNVGRMRWIR